MPSRTAHPAQEISSILVKALLSRFHSLAENKKPILYSERERRVGGQFSRKLRGIPDRTLTNVHHVYRQSFLWACANILQHEPVEWMIVGFGKSQGARIQVHQVFKERGEVHRVQLPPNLTRYVHEYLDRDQRASVLLVHNHTGGIIRMLLDLLLSPYPMPSLDDRDSAYTLLEQRLKNALQGKSLGQLKFFVIQNNEVAEFSGVQWSTALDLLRMNIESSIRAAYSASSSG